MMTMTCPDRLAGRPCVACAIGFVLGEPLTWSRKPGSQGQYYHPDCYPRESHATPKPTDPIPSDLDSPYGETTDDEIPDPPAGSDGSDGLAQAIAAAVSQHLHLPKPQAPSLDVAKVEALCSASVAREVAKLSPVTTIRIEAAERPPVEIKGAHRCFEQLLALAKCRSAKGFPIPIYLYGPAGSGKSEVARQLAEAFFPDIDPDLRHAYFSLNPTSPESRVIGFRDAMGVIHDPLFVQAYQRPGFICVDECDHASALVLTSLNDAISNGHGSFACGIVPRHKDCHIIATGNTIGQGGTKRYPERRPLDRAFRSRFLFLEWPIDLDLERRIVLGILPSGSNWIDWIQRVRTWADTAIPEFEVSPRSAYDGASMIAAGIPVAVAAECALFKGDVASHILAECPLPKVSR